MRNPKKHVNKAVSKYIPNTWHKKSSNSNSSSSSIGRLDTIGEYLTNRLIDGIGNDLGMPTLGKELNPYIKNHMQVLKGIEVPGEILAIGRAFMSKSRGE